MHRRPLLALVVLLGLTSLAHGAPSAQQLCESAMELASAKYAQCRLTAQSKDAKAPNPPKLNEDLAKCSRKLSDAFGRATLRYGVACAATEPSAAFDAYLKQCSDDTTAAAGGAVLPDYLGDLASCNADLGTCNGSLTTCNGDLSICAGELATATSDLASCEGDLAECQAQPTVGLLKTGQTTSFGAGTDGDVQAGMARSYLDNGDGTITDMTTGLMWEKKSDDASIHDKDNTYGWCADADNDLNCDSGTNAMDGSVVTTFLASLNSGSGFAGHTDWRLPNLNELESLRNLQGVPAVSSAFNTGCGTNSSGNLGCTVTTCSCTRPSYYWSSSTYLSDPRAVWSVSFDFGYNGWAGKNFASWHARAVRGGS